ncbi:hypothetical protein IAQ61_001486 [Plenodomus lingam]|uniref:Predicted protein n=1 Tax=Leptosphaeria maculans (strain JN3 / isolate v23.1.3 / race Av1-4-5-6-7-8) TaxID=985895 RepID=E4ZY69_LEPMJ|nr:predicted protein [Plenodomus lingam JN3]KAH9879667.1 hypothetical protein IAQ61_001486 [Plenodomus lingam]CBX96314.1 predicted protein [Plenodomus lingam JN3]
MYLSFFTLFSLVSLLPFSFSSPIQSPSNLTQPTTPLSPRANPLPGTCPHRHLPTESSYYSAIHAFCDAALKPKGSNIHPNNPITMTVFLTAFDNKPISWVFKISTRNSMGWGHVTREKCFYKFESMLTSEYAGGLGKAYCVMDGTGGDKVGREGMSGEGVVGVMGGKVTDPEEDGSGNRYTWEMRQKLDDKHGE